MKPGEHECTKEEGRVLVTIDPDLTPIPRHDMALIITGVCPLCFSIDEQRLEEVWLHRS